VLVAVDTLYDLLGIPRNASTEDVRTAYRRLTKIYHPDLGGTPAFFRLLQHAHETLADPFQRARYDRSLTRSGSHAKRDESMSVPYAHAPNGSGTIDAGSNTKGSARQGGFGHNRSGDAAHAVGGTLHAWSQGIRSRAGVVQGWLRRRVVTAIWITSAIVAGVLVAILLEGARGIVLLILLFLLILVVAVGAWRIHALGRHKAETRNRAEQATAEFNRVAWEAAERQRAARAAATEPTPPPSSEATHAARGVSSEGRIANATHSEESDDGSIASWAQFEYTMVALLGALGMTDLQRVKGGDDLAIDIAARDSVGRSIVARCRRCTRSEIIGARDVRQFIDTAATFQYKVLKLLVTTSDFTSEAQILADRHGIQLISGSQVEGLVRRSRRRVFS
jgi:hypothetical protein